MFSFGTNFLSNLIGVRPAVYQFSTKTECNIFCQHSYVNVQHFIKEDTSIYSKKSCFTARSFLTSFISKSNILLFLLMCISYRSNSHYGYRTSPVYFYCFSVYVNNIRRVACILFNCRIHINPPSACAFIT